THLLGSDPDAFDYYVVAEPVLTAVQAQYKQQNKTLNVIYNIQTEFAAAHDGAKVPAAAIFVSNAAYETKKAEIDTWLSETQTESITSRATPPSPSLPSKPMRTKEETPKPASASHQP
ncbi:MAG: hypothetical protein IKQ34_03195, partial [Bacilli bacterium]|nr:hypothetical protein [Bacilli bacterium]